MAASWILRAASVPVFLLLSKSMLDAVSQPTIGAAAEGWKTTHTVEWAGGSLALRTNFWGVPAVDEALRILPAIFAPSSQGFDPVSAWQISAFLQDLAPIYAIWFIESSRAGNKWTVAYFPTIFLVAAQLLGIAFVSPLVYILILGFGPSAPHLKRTPAARALDNSQTAFLLPLMLVLHTAEIFAAFWHPDPFTRDFWMNAWQLTPLWLGLGNWVLGSLLGKVDFPGRRTIASPGFQLGVLSAISAASWVYTLTSPPYAPSTLFVPQAIAETDTWIHLVRRAMQIDELSGFAAAFLWLGLSILDLYFAGLLTATTLISAWAALPLLIARAGPGAALAATWYFRERLMSA